MDELERFETLVQIMDRLRDPGGCPWDREQSYDTLRSYLVEECYEVVEALDGGDREALREELGDLLFQIVFLSRLAQEEGAFRAADVVRGIAEKMIRRHPHVFGDETAETSEQVLRNWEAIKRSEKAGSTGETEPPPASVLDGLPGALPALIKAQRLGTKAARVGFDWARTRDVLDKIAEELGELRQAVERDEPAAMLEEIGDLLFSTAMLARKAGVDPEGALERANLKFARRFQRMERDLGEQGRRVEEVDSEALERLWDKAKREPDGAG